MFIKVSSKTDILYFFSTLFECLRIMLERILCILILYKYIKINKTS